MMAIFRYFDASDVGWIESLSSETHRNQKDDRLPAMVRRPLTKTLQVFLVD